MVDFASTGNTVATQLPQFCSVLPDSRYINPVILPITLVILISSIFLYFQRVSAVPGLIKLPFPLVGDGVFQWPEQLSGTDGAEFFLLEIDVLVIVRIACGGDLIGQGVVARFVIRGVARRIAGNTLVHPVGIDRAVGIGRAQIHPAGIHTIRIVLGVIVVLITPNGLMIGTNSAFARDGHTRSATIDAAFETVARPIHQPFFGTVGITQGRNPMITTVVRREHIRHRGEGIGIIRVKTDVAPAVGGRPVGSITLRTGICAYQVAEAGFDIAERAATCATATEAGVDRMTRMDVFVCGNPVRRAFQIRFHPGQTVLRSNRRTGNGICAIRPFFIIVVGIHRIGIIDVGLFVFVANGVVMAHALAGMLAAFIDVVLNMGVVIELVAKGIAVNRRSVRMRGGTAELFECACQNVNILEVFDL